MNRVVAALVALVLLAVGSVALGGPTLPPPPTEWVTDTAGFLTEPVRQTLNARLETYERVSHHQVLVWVGKTTGGAPLAPHAARIRSPSLSCASA